LQLATSERTLADIEAQTSLNVEGKNAEERKARLGLTLKADVVYIERSHYADLEAMFTHRDLLLDCWAHDLKGGLKNVERRLGIHRDTEGLDGLAAIRLWHAHRRGDADALEVLLRYNREDVENLEILAIKLGVVAAETAPAFGGNR
jgi:hypothetical protein